MDTKDENSQKKTYYELVPGIRGPYPMSRITVNNGDGTKHDLVCLTPMTHDFGCICQEITTGMLFYWKGRHAIVPLNISRESSPEVK